MFLCHSFQVTSKARVYLVRRRASVYESTERSLQRGTLRFLAPSSLTAWSSFSRELAHMVSLSSILRCHCTDRIVGSRLCQGKRKSITCVRKRPTQTATLGESAVRSVAVASSPLASPVSARSSGPRQLLSTRNPPSGNLLPMNREADRVSLSSSCIISKTITGPGSKGTGSLKSRVKHVSQDIIRSKWTVLDGDAQAKVEELFRSIELPVLANYSSKQRKIKAHIALGAITGT